MVYDWSEKRKTQRVDASLNLEVRIPRVDGSFETASLETINISSSGVYFRSQTFMEPMTKLAMRLDVTVPGEQSVGVVRAPVDCEGLVVRVDPETPGDSADYYEIAVFFTTIEPDSLENLERHIAMLLDD